MTRGLRRCAFALTGAAMLPPAASGLTSPAYHGLTYPQRGVVALPAAGGAKVDTWNGDVVVARALFVVPGKGIPLELYLVYNSDRRLITSAFGAGWNLSVNIRYVKDASGNVRIVWGDGRVDVFTKSGSTFTSPPGVYLTLAEPAAGDLRLTSKHGMELRFAVPAHGRVTSIKDKNGNTMTFAFDEANRLATITAAGGRTYTLAYDAEGRLAAVADPNLGGRSWGLEHDATDRLTRIKDPLGHAEVFGYDAGNLLTTITDRRGESATLTYSTPPTSPGTRLPASVTKGSSTQAFGFDGPSRTTTLTDPRGNLWRYAYDAAGRIVTVTDPTAAVATFAWNGNRDLSSLTDGNGHTRSFTYDAKGNRLTATVPFDGGASATTTATYHPTCNRVASVTDRRGNTTSYEYDSRCNLVKVNDPSPPGTTFALVVDAAGQPTTQTDRTGRVTKFTYTATGSMAKVIDPLNDTTQYNYDGAGRLTRVIDPTANQFRFQYDATNRVMRTFDGTGADDVFQYDADGNLTRYTDREDGVWQLAYDALGRPVASTDPLGASDATSYDPAGNPVSYTDRRGNVWLQAFTTRGQLGSRSNPLGSVWQFEYDGAGNLVRLTDARGRLTQNTYDFADRLVRADFADTTRTRFTYDADDNLVAARDDVPGTATVYSDYAWALDAMSRRTSFTDHQLAKSVFYAYDGEGRLTSKTGPLGNVTTYGYDAAARLVSLTAFGGTSTFAVDAAGRRVSEVRPNGTSATHSYDANGRSAAVNIYQGSPPAPLQAIVPSPLLASYAYTWDAVGRLVATVRDSGEHIAFTRDGLGRITNESGMIGGGGNPPYSIDFTYDANGNRLTRHYLSGAYSQTMTGTFNQANLSTSLVTVTGASTSSVTFTHDANGAQITSQFQGQPVTTYLYDARNRLYSYGAPPAQVTLSWDVFNRLTSRTMGSFESLRVMYGSPRRVWTNGAQGGTSYQASFVGEPDLQGTPRPMPTATPGAGGWPSDDGENDAIFALQVTPGPELHVFAGGNTPPVFVPQFFGPALATKAGGLVDGALDLTSDGFPRSFPTVDPHPALLPFFNGFAGVQSPFDGHVIIGGRVFDPYSVATLNPGGIDGASSPFRVRRPGMPWSDGIPYDPEAAARMLEEAGWGLGDDGIRRFVVPPDPNVPGSLSEFTFPTVPRLRADMLFPVRDISLFSVVCQDRLGFVAPIDPSRVLSTSDR